jgi:hypothetical protein
VEVCEGLGVARTEAYAVAKTNEVKSYACRKAFGEILKREVLDELNKGTRDQCFKILEHLPAIKEWHAELDQVERLKINHPSTILRHWKKTSAGADALFKEEASKKKTKRVKQAALRKQVDQLKDRIKEVEQERDNANEKLDQYKREATPQFTEPEVALRALINRDEIKVNLNGFTSAQLLDLAVQIERLADQCEKRRSVN